jgi:Synaptobrevin
MRRMTDGRRRMWWKNTKLVIMIVFVAIFLLWVLVGLGCGLPGIPSFPLKLKLRMVEMQMILQGFVGIIQ